ncbi:DUF4168 domain-containing protein [Rhodohalobacter barkolensis]|uniref:DUF4168 domain-containing protein n=1 Tax=Rhodohalobacter barkolensis TaxID=2053187 RepID=A0A2N0VKB6_9BACT|nr:DUF4168 domain-containing protein [Rhodohalobacter barkolensis]PKD44614.1 hypothetical protein CWD77_03890 [Rhodohalobacter barkolensis]
MTFKYLSVIALALSMLACQSEQSEQGEAMTEQAPQEQQGEMQGQFDQQQAAPQVEVTDEELEEFVDVSTVAQEIQMEAQTDMVTVVEDEGLDVETYNVIAEARYNGQSDEELDVSADDLEKFDSASDRIGEMEEELDEKMAEAIEAEGMDMERFMELNMALQQDQELQQRVQQMMMDSQTNQQQQQQMNPEGS